jgi:carbamoyl-phosphate synthase large subunit
MNILLINPGRRDYLIKYFLDLKKYFKINLYLIDSDKNIPAFQVSNKTLNFICPKASKLKSFSNFLKKFIIKNKINIVFPISEHEMMSLAITKNFYEEMGVKIVISNKHVIDICKNKIKTYNFLKKIELNYPEIINPKNYNKKIPIILKEIEGSGSKNQILITNKNFNFTYKKKNFFLQKYLKSPEYGMDILNDLNGNFLHCSVKKKILMRAGDTDRAIVIDQSKYINFAKKISLNLRHVGNLDVDFLWHNQKPFILDLNPRFGGGYPFTHEYGYDYIKALILNFKRPEEKIKFKTFENKNNFFSKGINIYRN